MTNPVLDAQNRSGRLMAAYLDGDITAALNIISETLEDEIPTAIVELINQLGYITAGLAMTITGGDLEEAKRCLYNGMSEIGMPHIGNEAPDSENM